MKTSCEARAAPKTVARNLSDLKENRLKQRRSGVFSAASLGNRSTTARLYRQQLSSLSRFFASIPQVRRASGRLAALLLSLGLCHPAGAADDGLPALSHALTPARTPTVAPPLKLPDLDGKVHDLATLKGKVVLVNFWATWCPPCRREMPSLERLNQKLEGTAFAALAVDIGEDADTVFAFLGQLEPQPGFPMLLDRDSKAMQQWPVRGLPTTYIIDRQGNLAYSAIGGREFDHPQIEAAIRTLLGQ